MPPMDIPLPQIKPIYPPHPDSSSISSSCTTLIRNLSLRPHPEGGYFTETDRDPHNILPAETPSTPESPDGKKISTTSRAASSTIFYLLTPDAPLGAFHRHQSRTIHTWHRGRGRYVIIHDEAGSGEYEWGTGTPVESFVVGPDVVRGERMQWVVDAGNYKASYLLPDRSNHDEAGLLISEVVVPAFDFTSLEFLRKDKMEELLTAEQFQHLSWMLKTPLRCGNEDSKADIDQDKDNIVYRTP